MMNKKIIVIRGALFFAIALLFQGLRLIVPLPPMFSMFLIGSLVNMALILTVLYCGREIAVLTGCLLPLAAFFQGQLAIVFLIPLVAIGNAVLVILIDYLWQRRRLLWLVPLVKTLILYGGVMIIIAMFELTAQAAAVISFVMSWPQLITATIGLILAGYVDKKIPFNQS